jgi:hypothetical protein
VKPIFRCLLPLLSACALACSPGSDPGGSSSTSTGETTSILPTTGEGSTSSSGSSSSGLPTSDGPTSPTTGEPIPCAIEPATRCLPIAAEWCAEVAELANALPVGYGDALATQCAGPTGSCGVCFYLGSTCAQLYGGDSPTCAGLDERCVCLAELYGAP